MKIIKAGNKSDPDYEVAHTVIDWSTDYGIAGLNSFTTLDRESLVLTDYFDYTSKVYYEYKCKVQENQKSFEKQTDKYMLNITKNIING